MPGRVIIKEDANVFKSSLLFVAAKKIKDILVQSKVRMLAPIRSIVTTAMNGNPTIQSLLHGKLKLDFGLTDEVANQAVKDILNEIVESVEVNIVESDTRFLGKRLQFFTGGLSTLILSIKPNISNIVYLPIGSYYSDGQYGGGQVDWLKWLLTRGTEVVVHDFEVIEFLSYVDESRSNMGFMVKTGGSFRVDPEHAGTISDNFITRALDAIKPDLITIMKNEIRKSL